MAQRLIWQKNNQRKTMKNILSLATLIYMFSAAPSYALSCAWPSVEQAKAKYPVTVMGKVVQTRHEALPEDKQHMLARGYEHITLEVEHLRAPDDVAAKDGKLHFRETITMYDRSFFKEGKQYVVFLERKEDGELVYPVCGFHLRADDPMLDISEVKSDMGWK